MLKKIHNFVDNFGVERALHWHLNICIGIAFMINLILVLIIIDLKYNLSYETQEIRIDTQRLAEVSRASSNERVR
jgi:uncharacterized membrane protein